ncbi:MAG: MASE1 domain-containing protein [Steroidobacteraceae bacterium]
MKTTTAKDGLVLAAIAAVYLGTAKLGLGFASVNPSATAVWPPTGIALAALLVFGYRAWPAIAVGAFIANVTTQGGLYASLGIATGNTLEALVGAWLVNRFAGGRTFYERPRDLFLFAGFATTVSTAVSATIGPMALVWAGYATWESYPSIWVTWWLGDASGDLIVAPVLVMWATAPPLRAPSTWIMEAGALLAGLMLVALVVFAGAIPSVSYEHYPLQFLTLPFLCWAAFRLGRRAVALSVLVLSIIAIEGTVQGLGPFARASPNESLLLLQAYVAVITVTMLAMAAVVRQREQSEAELQRKAERDSLTNLPNYRHFITAVDQEIHRSERTQRSFAVLMLDLDRLKEVNDSFGHLAGNRALCRVARAIAASCRASDTPARFGGDEFAVILPETAAAGGQKLARRIRERLAQDTEQPPLHVSIGLAVYPGDGLSTEPLLSKADRALYAAKRTSAQASSTQPSSTQTSSSQTP